MRYARVPQGTSTCGYCYMLASRGWSYRTAEAAAAGSHEGCDCVVMAGEAGVELPYDVEWMRKCWADCVSTVDNVSLEAAARATWDAMAPSERAGWRVRLPRKTREFIDSLTEERRAELRLSSKDLDEVAFGRYYADELRRESWLEVERRDAGWLYRGVEPPVDYAANPREAYGTLRHVGETFDPADYDGENFEGKKGKEWRDLFAHDALEHHGFRVSTRHAKAFGTDGKVIESVTTPDIEIDGVIWEIKSPRDGETKPKPGRELSFIEKAVRDCKDNFSNPYDPNMMIGMGDMTSEARLVLNLRYRDYAGEDYAKRIVYEMERHGVCEVLVIEPSGSILRFTSK